jgi:hypothetical protein
MWLFVNNAFMWQHLDQFEKKSFVKVEKDKDFLCS